MIVAKQDNKCTAQTGILMYKTSVMGPTYLTNGNITAIEHAYQKQQLQSNGHSGVPPPSPTFSKWAL